MLCSAPVAMETVKPLISVVTPCWNEAGNVRELRKQILAVFDSLPEYQHEQIYIDNNSTDGTIAILRELAADDSRVKVIINQRNFGHIRSPYHAFLQASGDAVIVMVSDLQDPPSLIVDFLRKWREGFKIILGQKVESDESKLIYALRTTYYRLVSKLSDTELPQHVTGFGLYDRVVVEQFRELNDLYPYVRGIIAEFGYPLARISYRQPMRKSGVTKNNFYTLYDMAMLGITSHSKVPLRLATMLGFLCSFLSLLVAAIYFIYKLMFWNSFAVGIAPLVIGLFVFSSVQLFFIGMVGEYIGAIHTQILKRPIVVERERINF